MSGASVLLGRDPPQACRAPAVVLLQSVGSDRAGAQASEVTLSRQQLIINQRISQAAVRRGNR
ncbi:MAG TPA: hypothetical protein VNT51_08550, partial [Miltoncostaeaceae bacterium]|nr:hypothetical protein [Miltoncostaeaceae bacterium]